MMGMCIFRKDTRRGVAKCLLKITITAISNELIFGNLSGVGKYLVKVQPRSKLMMVVHENIPIDEK